MPPPEVINGRYELQDLLGRGGMGVVHRAHDRVLDRSVAVKVIREELVSEEFVRRFEREAAILARVRSPHIVVVFDYGSADGRFYLVTDYLPEGDLAAWLEAHGPMPPAQALPLMAAAAEGLADAHAHGVVHRDVKPGNVLLWRRGGRLHPVLADFGIAVTADLGFTVTGGVIGSPPFMAPERHLGEPATAATDVYAMGCMLFNLLTGDVPFPGTSYQVANAHINDPAPTLPADLADAAALDRIVARCMAKRPEDRYPSAAALAVALRRLVPPEPAPAPETVSAEVAGVSRSSAPTTVVTTGDAEETRDEAPAGRSGSRRLTVAAAVVAVLLLAAGVAGATRLTGPDDDPGPAGDTARSTAPASSSSSPTPTAPPPGPPSAEVVRGDRGVEFRVDLPPPQDGVATSLERRDDDGDWRPSETTFAVPTAQGGETGCAVVRLVNTVGDDLARGDQRRFCGRAAPRAVDLRAVPGAACTLRLEGQAFPCAWLDIVLRGFRTGDTHTVQWRYTATNTPGSFPVTVAKDGTAAVTQHPASSTNDGLCPGRRCPGGFPAPAAAEQVIVQVYGDDDVVLERTFRLDRYR